MSSCVDEILRQAALKKKGRRLYKGDATAEPTSNAKPQDLASETHATSPCTQPPCREKTQVSRATCDAATTAASCVSPTASHQTEPTSQRDFSEQAPPAPNGGDSPAKASLAQRSANASSIIARFAALCAGTGFVPIPLADYAATTALQITMAKRLAELYCVPYTLSYTRFVTLSLIGSISFDCLASLGVGALARFIPPLGLGLSALQGTVSSGVATLALGHILVRHLEAGGHLDDSALPLLKKNYQAELRTAQAGAAAS